MIIWGRILAAAILATLIIRPVGAQTVTFDFDTGTPALLNGVSLPIDQTAGGLTAHFSTPSATGFSVQSDSSTGWTMRAFSGHYLYPNGWYSDTIDVQLSQFVTSFAVTFATAENQNPVETPSSLAVNAYVSSVGATPVASATGPAAYLGDTWPTGVVSLTSTTPFNVVRLKVAPNIYGTVMFMIDNVVVTPAAPRAATMVYAPGVSGAVGETVALNAWLLKADRSASVAGRTLHVSVNGTEIGTGTTDAYGRVQMPYTIPQGASGSIPFSVAFTDLADPDYLTSSASNNITVLSAYPTRTYLTDTSGAAGETIRLQAWLLKVDKTGYVQGRTLSFSVGGVAAGSGTTDANGRAIVYWQIPTGMSSPQAISVSFAGDASYGASVGTAALTIGGKIPTRVWVPAQSGTAGTSVTLNGWLLKADRTGYVQGKTLHFLLDSVEVGTGVTDAYGRARLLYAIPLAWATSSHALTVSFTDTTDTTYATSSGASTLTVP